MVYPVHVPSDLPMELEYEQKIEQTIKEHFKIEFFLMLAEAERSKTATEVMELAGEKAAVMGAIIHNLTEECFDPLIDIVFNKEMRAGRLPEPPRILQGETYEVDYLGPLAQAQKKWLESQGITQGLGIALPMLEAFPESRDKINSDKAVELALSGVGFPQEAIRSDEEVEEIRALKAQLYQQQLAMEQAGQIADAVPKLNKTTEKGSVLEKLEEQV
jgi:hypothetical protein